MPISKESFLALINFNRKIAQNYTQLKRHLEGLGMAIKNTKIRKAEAKQEINAYLNLIEISTKRTDEGMKEFTSWLVDFIQKIPDISRETIERLESFRRALRAPMNYDEAIEELLNIAEPYVRTSTTD